MNFKFKHTEKIVGTFVFIALVILITGLVLIALSKKIFVETYAYRTKLIDAGGLSVSTTLNFKGYEIGRVKSFSLDQNNNIDVELGIYEKYRDKIVVGSVIYRQVNPITGNMSLIFLYPNRFSVKLADVGINSLALREGSYIPSLDMPDGQKLLEDKIVEKSGDVISIIFEDTRDFMSNIRQEFQLKKDSVKTFFEKIDGFSQSLFENKEVFDHLNRLLSPGDGPIFTMLNQYTEVANRLKTSADQLNQMLDNYKNPEGLMNKMLMVRQDQLGLAVENLNKDLAALHEILAALKEQSPLMARVLDRTEKTLQSLNNHPLLRGGIKKEGSNANTSKKKRVDINE